MPFGIIARSDGSRDEADSGVWGSVTGRGILDDDDEIAYFTVR